MNLLVEIGVEELPVASLDVIYASLSDKVSSVFQENHLDFGQVKVEATPRRIVLFVSQVAERQRDQELNFSGPSVEKAYDGSGKPTKALEGFLKSKNASVNDVKVKETNKGSFVTVSRLEKGKKASQVLPALLCEVFAGLSFPKLMRWEPSGFRFPRPIRWVVALLDKKVLSLKIAGVKADKKSYGHRFLAPKAFTVTKTDWTSFQAQLKKAHVLLPLEKRKDLVRKALKTRFHQKNYDEELLHTVAQLVEEPFFIQGSFSKTYLDLPAEVLASCMKKNQKIFACYDTRGRLVNKFVGLLNGKRNGLPKIRADHENVLESRLRDARFFYDEDTKTSLDAKREQIEQIVYLGKLGTMKDKSARLKTLAEKFVTLVGRDDLKEKLKRVAHLAKVDLVTQLVYEFPDLQGIVGREYAIEAGEDAEVAHAIGTQYLPKNLAQNYKQLQKEFKPLGALFGILDRLDLLVGAFGIGLEPTGSQDPFALRRAGGTVVKLIRAFGFHFSLPEAIELCAAGFGDKLQASEAEISKKLLEFLKDRMVFELGVKAGTRSQEILQAVFRASFEDLADAYDRYTILNSLASSDPENFLKAAKVVERTGNIVKGGSGQGPEINPELFENSLEKELYQLCENRSSEIQDWLARRDYEKATVLFGSVFYDPIHRFFDQVMVNVEDTAIRSNRHALMRRINHLYTESLADLSILSRLES